MSRIFLEKLFKRNYKQNKQGIYLQKFIFRNAFRFWDNVGKYDTAKHAQLIVKYGICSSHVG